MYIELLVFVIDVTSVLVFIALSVEYFFSGVGLKHVATLTETSEKEVSLMIFLAHRNEYKLRWENKAIIVFFIVIALVNSASGDFVVAVSAMLVSSTRHYSLLWAESVRELTKQLIKD